MSGRRVSGAVGSDFAKKAIRCSMKEPFSAFVVPNADIPRVFLHAFLGDRAAAATASAIKNFASHAETMAQTGTPLICCFDQCESELRSCDDFEAMLVLASRKQKKKASYTDVGGVCVACTRRWEMLSRAQAAQKISAVVRSLFSTAQLIRAPLSGGNTRHGGGT